jgi:molecular chaperone GrpE
VSDDEPAHGPENPEKGGATTRNAALDESPEPLAGELSESGGAAIEFHRRARLAEDRLAEVLAAYRQVKAENEDYRERTTRNIERRYEQRRERLLLKFIDILDSLDRALEAAEQSYAGNPFIEGLILVRTQLLQTLQEEGLERIPALGLPFDPAIAEAVGHQAVTEPDHHHVVVKELLRGYRLNGRIARASRVLVGDYKGEAEAPEEPEDLIGAEEVKAAAQPPLTADPLEELTAEADAEAPAELPLLEPLGDEEPADAPAGSGLESLDDIIAAAEAQEAEKMAWLQPEGGGEGDEAEDGMLTLAEPEEELVEEPPAEPVAEPAADDEFLRQAFQNLEGDQKR